MNGRPTLNGQNGASCPSHLVSDTGSDLLTKPSSSPKSSVTDPLLPKAGRRSGRDVFDLFRGILLGGASSVFFLICTIIVKLLAEISPSQLAIYRFVGILACSIPIVLRHKLQHPHQSIFGPSNQFGTLLLRGMMGASSLLLRFYAYRYLPLADASVLIFSVPVFVTLTAYFFLNVSHHH